MSTEAVQFDGALRGTRAYGYYVLAVLALVCFTNYMDRAVIAVLVQPIKWDLKLSDTQMGSLTGLAFAIFYATAGLPLAQLADRKRRTHLLAMALIVWSLMTALSGAAQSYSQLLLARVGVGCGEAGCIPASHSLISDYFRREFRATAIALFQAGGALGATLGLVLGGILADQVGWRETFVLVGLPGVLVAVVIFLTLREPPRGKLDSPHGLAAQGEVTLSYFDLLKRRTYRNVVLAYSLGLFASYGLVQWMPAFFIRVHGMSLTHVGLYFGLAFGVGSVVGAVAGGFLSKPLIEGDRRWEVWFPGLAYLAAAPLYLGVLLVPSTGLAIVLTFLAFGVSAGGAGPGLVSLQSIAPPRSRARAVALMLLCAALIGQGGGPAVVGWLSDLMTPLYQTHALQAALVTATCLFAGSCFFFFRAGRTIREERVC